jgi:Zn-dependent protease with chaperone function
LPFLVLLVLTLVCLQERWPEPPEWLGLWGSGLVTCAGIAGLTWAAFWSGARLRQQLWDQPWQRGATLIACGRQRRYLVLSLLGVYVLLLYFAGWGATATALVNLSSWALPGVKLLVLSPFVVSLVLLWTCGYDLELAIQATSLHRSDRPFPSRGAYVALQCRNNFILALPPVLLMLLQELVFGLLPEEVLQHGYVTPLIVIALLALVFISIPWLLRLFLGLRPLPPGPVRSRLLATAERLGFRCNDVLLWDTRFTIANAMVTGPLPWLRYVVLTDRLIAEMTLDELEAVFGHEVGHVKHHHMLFYFGFLMVSLTALAALWDRLNDFFAQDAVQSYLSHWLPQWQQWQQSYEILTVLPLVILMGAYIFVVFGFLSRRCERQADIYGCRTASAPVFIEALEKVALLNGISRDRPGWLSSWQHSTIAQRVDFIRQMSADPLLEPRFQRRVGLVKLGVILGLSAVLFVIACAVGPKKAFSFLNDEIPASQAQP